MNAIEFENVNYSYGGAVQALRGLSLAIGRGEFVCVLGGNGSGKSTLAKHMNALLQPDRGCVRVFGCDTREAGQAARVRSSVGMVFQNPDDQLVASIVEDEVAFGPENLGVEPDQIRERVTEALARVGLSGFERREVSTLSGGQKQRLALAGALAMRPDVIVLDEASSMLDPRGREELAKLCCTLNESGTTIVMITHFVEEALLSSRVVVMEDGAVAMDGTPADVFARTGELARLGLDVPFAARLADELSRRDVPVNRTLDSDELLAALKLAGGGRGADGDGACADEAAPTPEGPVLLSFDDVSFTYAAGASKSRRARASATEGEPDAWALRAVSFDVKEGEFLGVAGHTGSGKSTLVQLCNGLLRASQGHVVVEGADLADKAAAIRARRSVGVVFQYPEHQLFAATVFDDVAFGPRNLGLDEGEVARRVRESLALVHLDDAEVGERSPFALSGGQQRRVAFAGVLAMNPRVLVLDEPCAGLDPRTRESFLDLIAELHDKAGLSVVFVSHDMSQLARLCDRVLVLDGGRRAALGAPSQVLADASQLRAIGLDAPQEYRFAQELGLGLPERGDVSASWIAERTALRLQP